MVSTCVRVASIVPLNIAVSLCVAPAMPVCSSTMSFSGFSPMCRSTRRGAKSVKELEATAKEVISQPPEIIEPLKKVLGN